MLSKNAEFYKFRGINFDPILTPPALTDLHMSRYLTAEETLSTSDGKVVNITEGNVVYNTDDGDEGPLVISMTSSTANLVVHLPRWGLDDPIYPILPRPFESLTFCNPNLVGSRFGAFGMVIQ